MGFLKAKRPEMTINRGSQYSICTRSRCLEVQSPLVEVPVKLKGKEDQAGE